MTTQPAAGRPQQRGVALMVVLVMLLLASLALLGSLQLGWLGERRAGSESDAQRAFAAAEALLHDAERDILLGRRPIGATGPFFPQDDDDLDLLQQRLAAGHRHCLQGICLPADTTALNAAAWRDDLAALTAGEGERAIAATYGRFTQATGHGGHPLLDPAAGRAWYWVEVFRHTDAAGIENPIGDLPMPDRRSPFIYRITAYVQGLKPGTRVHLRSVFVPYPQNPSP